MSEPGLRGLDEPLCRYPTVPYAGQVLAVVGLGVARAEADDVIAEGARPGCIGAPKPAERATYRIAAGQAEAQLRSARAFFYETTEKVWETLVAADLASAEQASLLRLASAHLAKTSVEVAQTPPAACWSATCVTRRSCRSTSSSRRACTTARARC